MIGCAFISDSHWNMQRIPGCSSIFTAEAIAVDLASDFIRTCDINNKFIVFSDSIQLQRIRIHNVTLLGNKEIVLCIRSNFFLRFSFPILNYPTINISWLNCKLNRITALEINVLR